jgi:hypothetical protein
LFFQYGADPFVLDSNGRTALQCANGDCIQVLQTLTNNHTDSHQQFKQTTISPQHSTLPRPRPAAAASSSTSAPPYDKLPSTVI